MIQQEKPQFSSRNIPYKFGNNYLSPSYIHHNKNINTTSPSFLVDQASKIALATDSSIVENHRLSPDQSVATFLVVALVVELSCSFSYSSATFRVSPAHWTAQKRNKDYEGILVL